MHKINQVYVHHASRQKDVSKTEKRQLFCAQEVIVRMQSREKLRQGESKYE